MGQRGAPPAPQAIRILKGEEHLRRLAKAPAPQVPPDRPPMAKEAAVIWDRIMAIVETTQHIGALHAETFRQYCEVAATLNAMQPKGSKEWRELVTLHLQLANRLCLTPATSGGLVTKAPPERKLAKYVTKAG
jgi:hypothetical protein